MKINLQVIGLVKKSQIVFMYVLHIYFRMLISQSKPKHDAYCYLVFDLCKSPPPPKRGRERERERERERGGGD